MFLYFNIFLIFLGIGLVIPVLPVYFLKDLGLTGSDLGLLVAAFALSQMIISPFGGTLADKLGKKLIICIGLILFMSEFMFAVGHNFCVLMLSRVIGGMSAGMVMPGVTGLIADISPSRRKSKKLWLHVSDYQFWIHFRTGIGGFMAEVSHRMQLYLQEH